MPNYTRNIFRVKIRKMTMEEQKELLEELRGELMFARTLSHRGSSGSNLRLLRRKIAMLRTIMREKGFNYNPREGF